MNNGKKEPGIAKTMSRLMRAAVIATGLLSLLAFAFVYTMSSGTRAGSVRRPAELEPELQARDEQRPGHSEYLVSLTRRAMQEGFGRESVMVLEPQRGPGREVVARTLRALLTQSGGRLGRRLMASDLKEAQSDRRILSFVGERSYLEVYTDGTKFRFHGDMDDPEQIEGTRQAGRLSQRELETLGRRFISEAFGELVKLGESEKMTFLGARYLRRGGGDPEGRARKPDEAIASIAIFGREVDGVPVVGGGSKVAVWFANDRQPVGFDVDWPTYKRTKTSQRVLPQERLKARVQAATTAPTGAQGARVERFECGYVDGGVTRRGSNIQAGCSIAYSGRVGSPGQSETWARVEFVPAGEKVLRDPKWPLANFIASGKEPTGQDAINLGTRSDPGIGP